AQAIDPERNPAWLPAVVRGLARLGLARWKAADAPAAGFGAMTDAYRRVRGPAPGVTAGRVGHLPPLVAAGPRPGGPAAAAPASAPWSRRPAGGSCRPTTPRPGRTG